MNLHPDDGRLFYKLYSALMFYANERLHVLDEPVADANAYEGLPPESRMKARDALFAHRELIDEFVKENPAKLSSDQLEIVRSWKHAVVGGFYIFRYLQGYTIFLSTETVPKAYGVLALADPLEEVIGPYLPRLITTVLLPFRGKIIYDGLVSGFNITFGGGIKRMLNEEYKRAKADFGIITSLPFGGKEPEPPEEEEAVIVTYDRSGKSHETWIGSKKEPTIPMNLTHAQRKVLAEVVPALADRLKIDEAASRTISFTLKEVREIAAKCKVAVPKAENGMVRNSLRHITEAATKAVENSQGIGGISAAERVYQFKITLKGIKPPIWRRIQTKDCTLGKLHEHIQTAMGWTNSHLHQFEIGGVRHGDPELIYEGWEDEEPPVNSRRLKISKIVPTDGKRFSFDYEYDFGDGWEHEIVFEGCLRADKGTRYPLCLEGQRACPPEDVGGTGGYEEYLKTLSDPDNKEWDEMSDWRGPYRPEHFDAKAATKEMRKGLPNWRKME